MSGRVRLVQHSFAAGEVSPKVFGRSDVERYGAACETLENFYVMRQGGVTRRPGTSFVAEAKFSHKKASLVPFQFNDQQAYAIEAGDLYFRFYRDSGPLFIDNTDAAIANGTFNTDLSSWVERNAGTGDVVQTGGVARFTANNAGNEARLYQSVAVGGGFQSTVHVLAFRVVAGPLRLRIGTAIGGEQIKVATSYDTGWHTVSFTPGTSPVFIEFEHNTTGTRDLDDVFLLDNQPLELTTPYSESMLAALQYDQSADIMWFAHRNVKPRELRRLGDLSWSLVDYAPTADPFTTAGNFPRAVALWTSRLWWGGTDNEPRAVWGTQIDDFANLDLGTGLDDEAIKRTAAGGKVNVIQWFVPSTKELFIGTFGSEMRGVGDANGVVTPKNFSIKPVTTHGSSSSRPVVAANATMFLQRSRKKLRQFVFDFNTDQHEAKELTTSADHITGRGLLYLTYHEDPEPIIFGIRDDGQLVGMSFHPTEKLLAFHRHTTVGEFEADATIPHPDGDRDQVWAIARRRRKVATVTNASNNGSGLFRITTAGAHGLVTGDTVVLSGILGAVTANGTWVVTVIDPTHFDLQGSVATAGYTSGGIVEKRVRYVEFLDDSLDGFYEQMNTDSTLIGDFGSPQTTITGLEHLEGQAVAIIGDGAVYPDGVVTGGQVTLDPAASLIEIGLPYTSKLVTMRPEPPGGTVQGVTVARGPVTIRVLNTPVLKVNGRYLPDRSSEDPMDGPPALFSGDLDVPVEGWGTDEGKVTIEQDKPLPCTVLLIAGNITAGDM